MRSPWEQHLSRQLRWGGLPSGGGGTSTLQALSPTTGSRVGGSGAAGSPRGFLHAPCTCAISYLRSAHLTDNGSGKFPHWPGLHCCGVSVRRSIPHTQSHLRPSVFPLFFHIKQPTLCPFGNGILRNGQRNSVKKVTKTIKNHKTMWKYITVWQTKALKIENESQKTS